jgi:hypothetical protein
MSHKYKYLARREREYIRDNNKYTKSFLENQPCQVEIKPMFQRPLLFPRSGEEAGFSVWCSQSSEKSLVHLYTTKTSNPKQ